MESIVTKIEEGAYSVAEGSIVPEEEGAIKNNVKLLYKPEFIPFYLKEVKKYNFSNTEGLVYGFIRFYLASNPRGQFYFTNEQLAYMLDTSITTISLSIKKILECGEFRAIYKVKANGGTFRLLENLKSDFKKTESETLRKLKANNNKIKENKIKEYICSFNDFWKQYPKKVAKSKAKPIYERLATSSKKEKEIQEGLKKYLNKWRSEKTDIKYIPNPTTWLNQKRWEDEVVISNEQFNKNARAHEKKWAEVKQKEKRERVDLKIDDGKGGFVKLSDLLK